MARKKTEVVLARSQVMAMAERAVEDGAIKAVIVYICKDRQTGLTITEETSIPEAVYMIRVAEHMMIGGDLTTDAEDDEEEG